eukprot:m.36034 g.36034  ORF g.36034 m.36034 type:complete len:377 (+) comp9951_c0_seq1:95-1225(+)
MGVFDVEPRRLNSVLVFEQENGEKEPAGAATAQQLLSVGGTPSDVGIRLRKSTTCSQTIHVLSISVQISSDESRYALASVVEVSSQDGYLGTVRVVDGTCTIPVNRRCVQLSLTIHPKAMPTQHKKPPQGHEAALCLNTPCDDTDNPVEDEHPVMAITQLHVLYRLEAPQPMTSSVDLQRVRGLLSSRQLAPNAQHLLDMAERMQGMGGMGVSTEARSEEKTQAMQSQAMYSAPMMASMAAMFARMGTVSKPNDEGDVKVRSTTSIDAHRTSTGRMEDVTLPSSGQVSGEKQRDRQGEDGSVGAQDKGCSSTACTLGNSEATSERATSSDSGHSADQHLSGLLAQLLQNQEQQLRLLHSLDSRLGVLEQKVLSLPF